MWTYNEKHLREKKVPGVAIRESGCYTCKIEKAELLKSTTNKSEGVALYLRAVDEEKIARITLFYKSRKGVELDFISKELNQLAYLLKIKHENMKSEPNEEGKEIFPMLENRTIGVFLSYLGTKEKIDETTGEINYFENYIVKGFYHSKSKKTTQEIIEKVEVPETFEKFEKTFNLENKNREKREKEERKTDRIQNTMEDEYFPF